MTSTPDDQTTKPRIKYAPPMLLKLDALDGKGLCATGSGDFTCSQGFSADDCSANGTSAFITCVAGPGYT